MTPFIKYTALRPSSTSANEVRETRRRPREYERKRTYLSLPHDLATRTDPYYKDEFLPL